MTDDGTPQRDFIRDIIDEDNRTGKWDGRVHTRFPPEPNGYLHIGHAKAILLSFGIAKEYGGKFNLRFDDTNPMKEEKEFVKAQVEDIAWLGADWEDRMFYASDYFGKMYEYAEDLIMKGEAYVDDLSAEEMKDYKGDATNPGRNSPFRDRSIEENLDLFRRMRAGEFEEGSRVLRAKIDMASPNLLMRDPVMYRILKADHHNTGDEWCIYPMYDWAHGLEDSIEGITHSLCSLEFETHRLLYDWYLDRLGVYHPQQIEFARLNITYMVMSKRMLRQMVEKHLVDGWDDPRLPTIRGIRRRGYPPTAIQHFCRSIGVSRVNTVIPFERLEHSVRTVLNRAAPRFMGVLRPLKVVIENYPADKEEAMEVLINPEDPDAGVRKVMFSRELYIEQEDFMEDPPKKFYRLSPGKEVRFRNAFFVTCKEVMKDGDGIKELVCTIDPETRGGDAPDGRKVKATMHWVSARHSVEAEVRLYDKLFTVEDPMAHDGKDFSEFFNPSSLEVLKGCRVDAALKDLAHLDRFQFERLGYFCIDPDTTGERLVINRTAGLRDTWAKVKQQQNK